MESRGGGNTDILIGSAAKGAPSLRGAFEGFLARRRKVAKADAKVARGATTTKCEKPGEARDCASGSSARIEPPQLPNSNPEKSASESQAPSSAEGAVPEASKLTGQSTGAVLGAGSSVAKARTPSELRLMFLQQALRYTGVGYKQKYFEPDEEEYSQPLHLDCCGLVRRTMWDLQEHLGFRLGRWNQAYMYDTLLEHEVDSLRDMRPGDLVFYQGTYTKPGARQQKHRMVHIEIFLGGPGGRATLGSRWRSGVVSVFPSMRFASSSWRDVRIRLCRIEPWLRGVCVPCHPTLWEGSAVKRVRDKRSVFFAGEGGEQEEDEGEEDEGEGDEGDE